MGKDKRTNCCNARTFHDKGGQFCFVCKKKVTGNELHDITTRGTAKLQLINK